MEKLLCSVSVTDSAKRESSESLIQKIYANFSNGIHFATPVTSLRINEVDLVVCVLKAVQGLSSSLIYWDQNGQSFCAESGIYVLHLSHSSLHALLNQFVYAATCLKHVEIAIGRTESSMQSSPTLRAFSCSASAWLKRLHNIALTEETKIINSDAAVTPTLLGLASSLSSLCSRAEYLLQVVRGAIPRLYFESSSSFSAAEISVHILDYLYMKLDEVCLVQGGEEEAYQMLLYMFTGSLLPYIKGLDSWLFEGILDDPFQEMFFYSSRQFSVDEAEFWEKSYLVRRVQSQKLNVVSLKDKKQMSGNDSTSASSSMKAKEQKDGELLLRPLFIKDLVKPIVSAGKSLQLIQHIPCASSATFVKSSNRDLNSFGGYEGSNINRSRGIAGLTLSEIFCVSLAGLIGHGDHISRYFCKGESSEMDSSSFRASCMSGQMVDSINSKPVPEFFYSGKNWYKFLVDTLKDRGILDIKSAQGCTSDFPDLKGENVGNGDKDVLRESFCPQNPVITASKASLQKISDGCNMLSLAKKFCLPPLDDDCLWNAVFAKSCLPASGNKGTNYTFGFQFGESEYFRSQFDANMLEALFPFPTLLPSFQDDLCVSDLLPFQKNSTLSSRVLSWMLKIEPRGTPLPVVIMQESLMIYIKRQVDYIGQVILLKLMNDWLLMNELAVLRAIYLLGSGDLLQHFLTVIFSKLDKGETLGDDFELNTVLQESIRNSSDGMLLSTPDSLVVSIAKHDGSDIDRDDQANAVPVSSTQQKTRTPSFGIDGLDSLKFTYKVSWPLELIANNEAVKKYNQVMLFLLKVKRAKFVLDKARRWMWKGRGTAISTRKHHWLLEQKLLNFVDAFHQYVMDRVYHTAWRELCEGMGKAGSLDEVIEVHEAYLLTIQRQCFVVPEKLWAIIASRINIILGLALDFHSVQQTLSSGGGVSAVKARCQMEIDRIEKQFDDCIGFLLRVLSSKLNVGHFPHLVDLVTRINYNYFYMSDTGNLATVTGSEAVSSRPLKVSFRNSLK